MNRLAEDVIAEAAAADAAEAGVVLMLQIMTLFWLLLTLLQTPWDLDLRKWMSLIILWLLAAYLRHLWVRIP